MRRPGWSEVVIPVRDLPWYVEGLPVGYDDYLSQARFRGRRRIVNLLSLNALWLDLDYHQSDSVLSESAALLELLCSCPDFSPSYVLATGRGLAAVWLVELLPRWNAVQAELVDRFRRRLGADRRRARPHPHRQGPATLTTPSRSCTRYPTLLLARGPQRRIFRVSCSRVRL